MPRTSRSGRGTGVGSAVMSPGRAASISASVTDLRWSFSENENASGEPRVPDQSGRARPCPGPAAGPLRAVQMAEGHVAEPGEHGRGHVGDAADPDVALGFGGLPAGHEGVRGDHGAADAAGGGVGPDPPGRLGQHRLVRPGRHPRSAMTASGSR